MLETGRVASLTRLCRPAFLRDADSILRETCGEQLVRDAFEPFCLRYWWGTLCAMTRLPAHRAAARARLEAVRAHWDELHCVAYVDYTGRLSSFREVVEPYALGLTVMWVDPGVSLEKALEASITGLARPSSDAELIDFLLRTIRADALSYPLLNRDVSPSQLGRAIAELHPTVRATLEAGHRGSVRRIARRLEEEAAGNDD